MRSWYCIQRCSQYSRVRCQPGDIQNPLYLIPARGYASRQSSPGFGGHNPGPRPSKAKHPKSGTTKDSKIADGAFREEPTDDPTRAKTRRSFRIGPGKIILIAISTFIGYKIWTWQTDPHRSVILNPRFFTPFILEKREKVSSTSSILTLQSLPKGQNTENVAAAWKAGVWSVQVMQPELQIARAYTPLPPSDAEPEQLRLFVRQEPQGEVSTFLHKISRGTLVHMRGPQLEYELPKDVDEVLFIAGGTGIAPALQIAHTLYKQRAASPERGPVLRILWANRRREDSFRGLEPSLAQQVQDGVIPKLRSLADNLREKPDTQTKGSTMDKSSPPEPLVQTRLVEEVEALKSESAGKVTVDYLIDEESSYIDEGLLRTHLAKAAPSKRIINDGNDSVTSKRLILISGPEGFVNFYAGPKSMKGGKEIQGPLGGMLQKINPEGWEIWKL